MRVLTLGTFDLLHPGHLYLLAQAAKHGSLTVGVNSDRFVRSYKGEPVEPEEMRIGKVAAVPCVAETLLNDGPGCDLIDALRPELLVIGSDWLDRDYLTQIAYPREKLEELACDILFVARMPGLSTSLLRGRTVTAIVVTHANEDGARRMLDQLAAQTCPPDETILVATETPADAIGRLVDAHPRIQVSTITDVGDWGHAKRARGLNLATCNWVGFFNDDDTYTPDYLEKMLDRATPDVDVVYCAWNENPGCEFAVYQSTAGNFLVRLGLAEAVGGWPTDRLPGDSVHPDGYLNDGHFIEALKAAGARTVKVDEPLYWHNVVEAVA